jgi:myosin heavy subunit
MRGGTQFVLIDCLLFKDLQTCDLFQNFLMPQGAEVQTYLLERTRLTNRRQEEGNFKVFHQMLTGLDRPALDGLGLLPTPHVYQCVTNLTATATPVSSFVHDLAT